MRQFVKYFFNCFRHLGYRIKGSSVPFFSYVRHNVTIRKSHIGRYCYIGENSGLNSVELGNYCSVATCVRIGDMEHAVDDFSTSPRLSDKGDSEKKTIIGPDVWIGTQACIRQGVRIGMGAIVGAQSFVNKDVPPYAIVIGTPARILRYRFSEELQNRLATSKYWEYSPGKARKILNQLGR